MKTGSAIKAAWKKSTTLDSLKSFARHRARSWGASANNENAREWLRRKNCNY